MKDTCSLSGVMKKWLAIVMVTAMTLMGIASASAGAGLGGAEAMGEHNPMHGVSETDYDRTGNSGNHHADSEKAPANDHHQSKSVCCFVLGNCNVSALSYQSADSFNPSDFKQRVPLALSDRIHSRTLDVETPPPRS